jgi:predicted adenylyl cyclase CyaB
VEPRRNIELKARNADPARSLAVCAALGAEDRGVLEQRDTYFHATRGRLKLREEMGSTAHLIAYERADLLDRRESMYRIVEVEDAAELRLALAETLGVKVVVSKRRRLFIWRDVRIHLDEVQDLGDFLEFEAIVTPDRELAAAESLVEDLRGKFCIAAADLVAGSYSDLALRQQSPIPSR